MIPAINAEVRKLTSVRSTYFILGISILLIGFFGFYVSGWHIDHLNLLDPRELSRDVAQAVHTTSTFLAIIALLLVTHEYRYNTIMHTLTLSNSRSKVLTAKIIVITVFALIFTALFGLLAPLLALWGIHAHHLKLVPQTLAYSSFVWKSLFYGWSYSMAGLVFAVLIRNQVGTIIAILIGPATVEGLLGLVLKNNSVYMPFTALDTTLGVGMNVQNSITPFHAALVFGSYLVGAWIIAWTLFLRRDAN